MQQSQFFNFLNLFQFNCERLIQNNCIFNLHVYTFLRYFTIIEYDLMLHSIASFSSRFCLRILKNSLVINWEIFLCRKILIIFLDNKNKFCCSWKQSFYQYVAVSDKYNLVCLLYLPISICKKYILKA